ncbi:MGMT family protein [Terrimonas alba]|uniref:MGMT family protein n=1 Tax=Terrimonas alba TaxID=3349636 RepID=UPI0035F4702F
MKKKIPAKKVIKKSAAKKKPPVKKNADSFFEMVYDIARLIPKGRVTSYGAIANYAGIKLSARMVGWAMNGAGRVKPKVPAHRVVNRLGMLSGKHHFGNPDAMEKLLNKEGIKVKNDKIVDFEKLFWNPATDLDF